MTGQCGFDRRRIGACTIERRHDRWADMTIPKQGEQEQLDTDAAASITRGGIGGGVQDPTRIGIQVFVQLSEIHRASSVPTVTTFGVLRLSSTAYQTTCARRQERRGRRWSTRLRT